MSSATIFASSWPMNSIPSPIASPRLSQPQHTVEICWPMPDQCSQRIWPVLASSAKTSSFPVLIRDPVFDQRRRLERILAAEPGALEARHPGSSELFDVAGVDLLQRRVAFVGHIAAIRHPVLADRALQQLVDFGIGGPNRARDE